MKLAKHWAAALDDYAIDLAWSPDGATLAAASAAGGVTLYDAASGVVRHALPGHEEGANCLAWLPTFQKTDDREQRSEVGDRKTAPAGENLSSDLRPLSAVLLVTGGQDGCVRFWDPGSGRQTAEARIGSAWVEHLAVAAWPGAAAAAPVFAAAGRKLVALRADGTVAHAFPDAPKTISALALSGPASVRPRPAAVLAAAYFGGVCTWDAEQFVVDREFPYGNAIHALVWSPDGRWLVAGCQDNAVHLWAPGEDLELHMSGYETKLRELSFSHDSARLATGGGKDACVWDCTGAGPEGREPLLLPHSTPVQTVAYQNGHGLLAVGTADGEFCLWAPTRKNPLVAEVRLPAPATKFAWRPDDSLLAVGTTQGGLFVFAFGD
jgi:WD40 repeat protein